MKIKIFFRRLSLFSVILFALVCSNNLIWAISSSLPAVTNLKIPSQYGIIKEVFNNQPINKDKERTIIHIQDAHCNYEAQKNMARLLEYLVKEYGLKLIMVEGGSGNVSLSFLRNYADKKARQEVAERYLKKGQISGEEYLDITSDHPLDLYGVEDQALYEAHLASFGRMDSIREAALRDLFSLSAVVEKLKSFVYDSDLIRMEKAKKEYEDNKISLAKYCLVLKDMIYKKGLSVWDYPQLVAFSETASLEEDIDFKKAEAERNAFIKDLAYRIATRIATKIGHPMPASPEAAEELLVQWVRQSGLR